MEIPGTAIMKRFMHMVVILAVAIALTHVAAPRLHAQSGDSDGDGVLDGVDNCPDDFNDEQLDLDGDGIGDVCDLVDLVGLSIRTMSFRARGPGSGRVSARGQFDAKPTPGFIADALVGGLRIVFSDSQGEVTSFAFDGDECQAIGGGLTCRRSDTPSRIRFRRQFAPMFFKFTVSGRQQTFDQPALQDDPFRLRIETVLTSIDRVAEIRDPWCRERLGGNKIKCVQTGREGIP